VAAARRRVRASLRTPPSRAQTDTHAHARTPTPCAPFRPSLPAGKPQGRGWFGGGGKTSKEESVPPVKGIGHARDAAREKKTTPRFGFGGGKRERAGPEASVALKESHGADAKRRFGLPLDRTPLVADGHGRRVPEVLHELWTRLRACAPPDNLDTVGIFRLSADESDLQYTKQQLNLGAPYDAALKGVGGICLAALIKAFLRALPDDLWASVRSELDDALLHDKEVAAMDIIRKLPQPQLDLCMWIVDVMHTVVANEPVNRMGVEAMSVVVAPNLLRPPDVPDASVIFAFTQRSVKFLVTMLTLHIQEHPTPPTPAAAAAEAAGAPEAHTDERAHAARAVVYLQQRLDGARTQKPVDLEAVGRWVSYLEYVRGLVAGLDTPDPQYHAQYAEQICSCVRDLGVE